MAINEQDKITVPFANSGLRNDIPEATTGSNLASMQEGFPAVTMTDIASGGQPPDGKDFNGILNVITKILQYAQSGGLYKYDADYAEAVNGYPVGAILRSADGQKIWLNTTANNSSDPDNGGQNWVALTDASSLTSALSGYLPKSGGTMSGTITTSTTATLKASTNNSFISLQGSSTGWNNGAQVSIYGENNSGPNAGGVQLIARKTINGSIASSTITLKPDGSIVLNNNGTQSDILTSASTLDASKLNISYLPTAGGTVTGTITSGVTNSIRRNVDDSFFNVLGGTTFQKGAWIALQGIDSQSSGQFQISARDSTSNYSLTGKPDGSLKWVNNEVLTTANGLPISGGTMTGFIHVTNGGINNTATNGSSYIYGGTSGGNGAFIQVNGMSRSYRGGGVVLQASNGTIGKEIVFLPNGSLTLDGKNILREDTLCTTKPTTTSTASASNPTVVVENYYDSTTGDWYSVRSDGWVEQGGYKSATGSQTEVGLLVEMADSNYSVRVNQKTNRTGDFNANMHVYSTNTNKIVIHTSGTVDSNGIYWEVKGYKK